MLALICPQGCKAMPTSRLNYFGMGTVIFEKIMQDKNDPSLEHLISGCLEDGARFWCCKLSREVMGYDLNDLIDGVKEGTAVDFLQQASTSDFSLFI